MDLLQFEADNLYFEAEDTAEVTELIRYASEHYGDNKAELPLLKAYLRAPESLNVLVALNRFYYYQHRLSEALLISEKALSIIRWRIGFPENWQSLETTHVLEAPAELMTSIRLYLFTLKSIGFLNLRLHNLELSRQIFEKLVALDSKDRIGGKALLDMAIRRQAQLSH